MFYDEASRQPHDQFDTRRIADRLYGIRRRDKFTSDDRAIIKSAPMFSPATADS
jgi:hypothetical protein